MDMPETGEWAEVKNGKKERNYPVPPLKCPPIARDRPPPPGGGGGKLWYPPLMQANRTQVKRLLH